MGAWANLNSSGNFATTTGGWSVVSTTSASTGNLIWEDATLGGSYFPVISNTYGSLSDLKRIAEEARKWIEQLAEESPNFTHNLEGMCALASRKIHKDLKALKIKAKLAYLNNSCYQHVFVIVPGKKSGADTIFPEDQIVDITASLYGEDSICVFNITQHDPVTQPWWSYDHAYSSESGLISRQKKDKWPVCQITFQAAKTKQTKLEFVMVGKTDIERGLIRIRPFDVGAVKYFKQQSRGEGLKSNLASLILDSDKQVADSSLTIAEELLNR